MLSGLIHRYNGKYKREPGILLILTFISVASAVAFFAMAQSSGVTGVNASSITDTGAQVVWTTDVPGSSHVYYNSVNDGT